MTVSVQLCGMLACRHGRVCGANTSDGCCGFLLLRSLTAVIFPSLSLSLCVFRCPNEFTGDRCQNYVMASFYSMSLSSSSNSTASC